MKSNPAPFPGMTLAAILTLGLLTDGVAQNDDFNDGNDNGWSHNDPLGELGLGAFASFSVINGQYRIAGAMSPNPGGAGPARAASLRQDAFYSTFCVSVDIIGEPGGLDPAIGLLARIQPNPGLGATDGYALTLTTKDNDIQITRVDNEGVVELSGSVKLSPPYDPSHSYRLVLVGSGDYLEGAIYDLADLSLPVAVTSTFDGTHAFGTLGLVVFDNSTDGASTVSAVFDNYRANDGSPPPLEILLSEDSEVTLRWPDHAQCFVLQENSSLLTNQWIPVNSGIFHVNGSFQHFVGVPQIPASFFRLALRGAP